jgi:hypothetical protein
MVGYHAFQCPVQPPELATLLIEFSTSLPVSSTRVRIQPAQISFVACEVDRPSPSEKPLPESLLRFKGQGSVPENEFLRECLIFYSYSEQRLAILGHIPLARYNAQHREDYIMLKDVDRPDQELAYELGPDTVTMMRELKPYYRRPNPLPEIGFEDLGNLIAASLTASVVPALLHPGRLATFPPPALATYLLDNFLGQSANHAVAFAYLLLIAGIEPDYARLLVRREKQLLEIRLNRYWTGERLRAVFCNVWFPGIVEVSPVLDSRSQFPLFPFPGEIAGISRRASMEFTNRCRTELGYLAASPGTEFRISPLFRASVNTGTLPLCSQQLVANLSSCLERQLNLKIAELQLKYSLSLYKKLYMPVVLDALSDIGDLALERRVRFTDGCVRSEAAVINKMLSNFKLIPTKFEFLYPVFDKKLLLWRIIPSLYSAYGVSTNNPEEWSDGFNAITAEEDERKEKELASRGPALDIKHDLPESREDALLYSKRFWPACMRRMLEQSYSTQHLNYTERLSCTGMLKSFGYTLQQAEKLWEHFFSATTVYEADFKKSEYGRVVTVDYTKPKQGGCGNCKTMASKGVCPFGDLEDFGVQCARDLNENTGRTARYPISHPAQYFKMALSTASGPGSPRNDE